MFFLMGGGNFFDAKGYLLDDLEIETVEEAKLLIEVLENRMSIAREEGDKEAHERWRREIEYIGAMIELAEEPEKTKRKPKNGESVRKGDDLSLEGKMAPKPEDPDKPKPEDPDRLKVVTTGIPLTPGEKDDVIERWGEAMKKYDITRTGDRGAIGDSITSSGSSDQKAGGGVGQKSTNDIGDRTDKGPILDLGQQGITPREMGDSITSGRSDSNAGGRVGTTVTGTSKDGKIKKEPKTVFGVSSDARNKSWKRKQNILLNQVKQGDFSRVNLSQEGERTLPVGVREEGKAPMPIEKPLGTPRRR